jgi:hypothetical protein
VKTYLTATSLVFGLILLAHAARVLGEGFQLLQDPFHGVATLITAFMFGWSLHLLWRA